MNKTKIKRNVDLALYTSIVGVFVAFPFQSSFLGGALFALCSAASIGGLADSFAVSALFGDPLKVKWPSFMGTHIIARRKEALIQELVNMVQDELLTVETIRKSLEGYKIVDVLLRYVKEHGGAADINDILQRLAADIISKINVPELADTVQSSLLHQADKLEVADIIADIGEWTLQNRHDERIADFLIHELIRLNRSEVFRSALEQLVTSAIRSYEAGITKRKLANWLARIKPSSISDKFVTWMEEMLLNMLNSEHPFRRNVRSLLEAYVERLRTDKQLQAKIEHGKQKLLQALRPSIHLDVYIREVLEPFQQVASASINDSSITAFPWIEKRFTAIISEWENDPARLADLDASIKAKLIGLVEQNQTAIGAIVAQQLHAYNDEEIIAMVKDKTGHDLQYIRLNGIGVGAMLGLVLYLLTFWIGG